MDAGGNGGTCKITNCYSTGAISYFSGGIAGSSAGFVGNCTISNCYSTGDISGGSGGIAGDRAGYSVDTTVSRCTITNCYSTGTVDDTSGGIAGSEAGSIIPSTTGICTLNNCYVTGTNTNTNKYFGADKGSDASTPTNDCGSSSGWSDSTASNVLVNTSGIWKRFVDNSGTAVNSPWQIVTFLSTVTAINDGNTITYSNSLFPVNSYAGFSIIISDGSVDINGTLDVSEKVATFLIGGTAFDTSKLIYLGADGESDKVIDSFYVNTSQINIITSSTSMTRDDIYNYKYSYPINVTSLDIDTLTHVTIDNNVIVGNLQFNIDDGNRVTIGDSNNLRTIQVNDVVDYPGLVQSWSNNTVVTSIGLLSSGSTTLAYEGGWIGQGEYDPEEPEYSITFIGTIYNCYSTGAISDNSGGIAGYGGSCTIYNCYSTGAISNNSGGIAGTVAGINGNCTIYNCYSTGNISDNSGGIAGSNAGSSGSCTIYNCYSTGAISNKSGGIVGHLAGINGNCTIYNCYSTGNISYFSGGIAGSQAGYSKDTTVSRCTITNCYSSGTVDATSGGIAGTQAGSSPGLSTTGRCTLDNCYVTGTNTNTNKYFGADKGTEASTPTNNCGSSSGWTDATAIQYLTGSTTTWKAIYLNNPWKLSIFLKDVSTDPYTGGTLVYTNTFPISAYPNALTVKLINSLVNGGQPYGSADVTLTQKSVTLTGVSGIDNGVITYLALYDGSNILVDYANYFIKGELPITTTTTTTTTTTKPPTRVTSIKISPTKITLYTGVTKKFVATIVPSNASNTKVTWKSSNTKIATVSTSGSVKGIAPGSVTIQVKSVDGTHIANSKLTVLQKVIGVKINITKATIKVKANKQLKAIVAPSNATNKKVTWMSSNKKVATVSASGVVTGLAPGKVTITCTSVDGSKKATSTIIVTK